MTETPTDHAAIVAAAEAALASARRRYTDLANQHVVATQEFDAAAQAKQNALDNAATSHGILTVQEFRLHEQALRAAEEAQLVAGSLATSGKLQVERAEVALLTARRDAGVAGHHAAIDRLLAEAKAADVAIAAAKDAVQRFNDARFDLGLSRHACLQHDSAVREAGSSNAILAKLHASEHPVTRMPERAHEVAVAQLCLVSEDGFGGDLHRARHQRLEEAARAALGINTPSPDSADEQERAAKRAKMIAASDQRPIGFLQKPDGKMEPVFATAAA